MNIGKLHIGYRSHDKHLWKKYLLPKAYLSDKYFKHNFFKFYYRWLNFFWCMPRRCECCGNYMTGAGGNHIKNFDGDKIVITICANCMDSKEYNGRKGYSAWLHEVWDKEREANT